MCLQVAGAVKNHRMKKINTFAKKKLRLKNMDHKLVMRKQEGRRKMNRVLRR